jgi:hypothetical protein
MIGYLLTLSPTAVFSETHSHNKKSKHTDCHFIDSSAIPSGVVAVPVVLNLDGVKYDTVMTAGHGSFTVLDDGVEHEAQVSVNVICIENCIFAAYTMT